MPQAIDAGAIGSQLCHGVAVSAQSYRRLAAFAVATLVLAQLQVLSHRAAVRHVLCAKHGELVEAPELAGGALDDHSRMVGVAVDVDAGDDHCVVANGLRSHVASRVCIELVAVAPLLQSEPQLVKRSHSALTGYRIAPKTSPPA